VKSKDPPMRETPNFELSTFHFELSEIPEVAAGRLLNEVHGEVIGK